jgi:excisionase family DNA binding protein
MSKAKKGYKTNSINLIIKKIEQLEDKIDNLQVRNQYPPWMDINQLSKYINLSKSAIRRMVSKNEIPYQRAGSTTKLIFSKKKIDLWLLTGEKNPHKRARKLAKEFINE